MINKVVSHLNPEVEKMSKSKWNVVNPDELVEQNFGAILCACMKCSLVRWSKASPGIPMELQGFQVF